MPLAKVYNDGTREYVEMFKEQEIRIPAKGFVEMDQYEASQFIGQFVPFKKLGNGEFTHEKRLRIVKQPTAPNQAAEKTELVCQMCLGKFKTESELIIHSKKFHGDAIIEEPTEPEVDAKKAKR